MLRKRLRSRTKSKEIVGSKSGSVAGPIPTVHTPWSLFSTKILVIYELEQWVLFITCNPLIRTWKVDLMIRAERTYIIAFQKVLNNMGKVAHTTKPHHTLCRSDLIEWYYSLYNIDNCSNQDFHTKNSGGWGITVVYLCGSSPDFGQDNQIV